MSRFANLEATEVIDAPCRCDGKVYNFQAARLKLLELGIVSWNLLGPTGRSWEPSPVTIGLLDKETVTWIATELNKRLDGKSKGSLPNGSAGRSRTGSSETSSPTLEIPAQPSSTTSS